MKKLTYILKIAFVIIVIIGIYVAFNFVKLFSREHIKVYEVNTGEIVNVDRHKGIIYRDEEVANCKESGFINFYVASGEKISRGSFVYTINDTKNVIDSFELNSKDVSSIKQSVKMNINGITNLNFSNIYSSKENIVNLIDEINIVKQLENIDIEKELDAKEKGYAKSAGIVSFIIDGMENADIKDFSSELLKNYSKNKQDNNRNEVTSGDFIYKVIKNPEFSIAFDSDFDYDNFNKQNFVRVKFIYENVTADGKVNSFIGNDGKKHFVIKILSFPEKFIDKRYVEFEIENKKLSGYKIPIKSIIAKNCYVVPKQIVDYDTELDENILFKIGPDGNREKITVNISKEDDKYIYISIDDALSTLKFGDVLTNRYGDTFSLSEVKKLEGVYNMNRGYAVFKNIDVIDRTNEYAIIKRGTTNGVSLYDHIALNASEIDEGDLISS